VPNGQRITPWRTGMAGTEAKVTVFICANCARGGVVPSARFRRPIPPAIPWQAAVKEVVVPCTGRIQPEHLLRAFEAGAEMVCVIACEEDDCHYLEGSCRAARRCEYVGGLLEEIGLGRERLALFHLPGSARKDMAAGAAGDPTDKSLSISEEELSRRVGAMAEDVAQRLRTLPPNPMHPCGGAAEIGEVKVAEAQEAEVNDE
jgi:F420-non-reducing hydrogenase iron-sulfur subunit